MHWYILNTEPCDINHLQEVCESTNPETDQGTEEKAGMVTLCKYNVHIKHAAQCIV